MDIRPLSVSDMEIPFSVAFHSSLTSIKGEVSLSLGVHPGIHEENCDVVEGEKLLSINWCLGALTSATGNSKATAVPPPPPPHGKQDMTLGGYHRELPLHSFPLMSLL